MEITGDFKFGGSLTWGPGPYKSSGNVKPDNEETCAIMKARRLNLVYALCLAIGDKLFCLRDKYSKQVCHDGGRDQC